MKLNAKAIAAGLVAIGLALAVVALAAADNGREGEITSGFVIRSAAAQTTFGTLSNFDVFNDTGQECHGFEIELDGVSSADVTYTFGAPYERYGNPTVVDFAGGVYVRYESPYDYGQSGLHRRPPRWRRARSRRPAGHACWTGGSANYLTSGCEHFGDRASTGNPTNTMYRWLVADPRTRAPCSRRAPR